MADTTEPRSGSARPRLLALDAARGLALIAMASYHFSWDLEFFGYLAPGTSTQGFLRIYARMIASSFLFLAGFSLVLAQYPKLRLQPFLRRLGMGAQALGLVEEHVALVLRRGFALGRKELAFELVQALLQQVTFGLRHAQLAAQRLYSLFGLLLVEPRLLQRLLQGDEFGKGRRLDHGDILTTPRG